MKQEIRICRLLPFLRSPYRMRSPSTPLLFKPKMAVRLRWCSNLYTSYVKEGVDKPLCWNSNVLYVIITHPIMGVRAILKSCSWNQAGSCEEQIFDLKKRILYSVFTQEYFLLAIFSIFLSFFSSFSPPFFISSETICSSVDTLT